MQNEKLVKNKIYSRMKFFLDAKIKNYNKRRKKNVKLFRAIYR